MFVSMTQLFYGQEKYTIQGELPDHSLDNAPRFIESIPDSSSLTTLEK